MKDHLRYPPAVQRPPVTALSVAHDPEKPQAPAGCHQPCLAFAADDIHVHDGVNHRDSLQAPERICLGDIYHLAADAQLRLLGARSDEHPASAGVIAQPDMAGLPIARYMLMAHDGQRLELLLLRVGDQLFAQPYGEMRPRCDYILVEMLRLDAATSRANNF